MTPAPKRNRQRAIAKRVSRMLGDRTLCPRCQATFADLGGVLARCPWDKPNCVAEAAVEDAYRWAVAARKAKIRQMRKVAFLESLTIAGVFVALMALPIWRLMA